MLTDWTALLLAGLFEVGFITALKLEQRSKHFFWLFLPCAWISFSLLARAIESIPLGTAYAVWTGIGAVGTTLVSALLFRDRINGVSFALMGCAVLLIIGLKATS